MSRLLLVPPARGARWALVSLLGGALPALAQAQPAPLDADTVAESVLQTHPQILEARAKVRATQGDLTSTQGAFDLQMRASAMAYPIGSSTYATLDASIAQPTTWWGLTLLAGWRASPGKVPFYKDQFSLKEDYHKIPVYKGKPDVGWLPGAFHVGAVLPLWQGGPIDKQRAQIAKARAKQEQARAELVSKTLALQYKGVELYWKWVAAGQRVQLAEQGLGLAQVRAEAVRAQIERGAVAPVEDLDNQSAILSREGNLAKARRKFQEASLKLSLYLREPANDENDLPQPLVPPIESVPQVWPEVEMPEREQVQRLVRELIDGLPQVRVLDAEIDQYRVEAQLAQNRIAPAIDLVSTLEQQATVPVKSPEWMVGVYLEMPLQRREARGNLESAEANIARLQAARLQARDTASRSILDAYSELVAMQQIVAIARRNLEVAQALEDAEREKVALGYADIFKLNLREQYRIEAAQKLIDSLADLHIAQAALAIATGQAAAAPNFVSPVTAIPAEVP